MEIFFTTKLNYELNTINVGIGNNRFYVQKNLNIKVSNCDFLIFEQLFLFANDNFYWVKTTIPLTDFIEINIEIKYENKIVFVDSIRIRDNKNNLIKKIGVFVHNIGAMGDTFSSEPIIRKLSESYNQKIRVYTHHPELFINHPNIESVVKLTTFHSIGDYERNIPEKDKSEYLIFYTLLYHRLYGNNYVPHWASIDLRQLAAIQCGITLLPTELNYHFYPDPFEPIPDLPDKYVCINPSIGSAQTWKNEKWQILIDRLNDLNINVVIIGRNNKDLEDKLNNGVNLTIKKGIDLSWKTTLSQAWHVINKSDLFITNQSLLTMISSTTDVNILVLGNTHNPEYQKPYRNGSTSYKICTVNGFCKHQFCTASLKYSVLDSGTTNFEGVLVKCHLDLPNDKIICYPSVDQIYNKSLEILNKEKLWNVTL